MIKRVLIVVMALLVSTAVYADDASHRKACEDLMKMFNIDKMLGTMFEQVKKMQSETFAKMDVPEDMKETSKKYADKMNDLLKKEMSWDSMKNDFIGIYMEVFSEAEVKEMIGFYNSPIGKKLVDKSPELMQKVLAMSQERTMKLIPEIERLSKEMAEEIRKRKQPDK